MLQAAQLSCLHSGREGALRYRQIEYHRMPLMTYLAFDDPRELARNEFIRRRPAAPAGAGRRRGPLRALPPGTDHAVPPVAAARGELFRAG